MGEERFLSAMASAGLTHQEMAERSATTHTFVKLQLSEIAVAISTYVGMGVVEMF